ncbi:MAG TPA: pitrilysin family protein [Pyrinomonadaceae bacterium]|nr:pitrilysin family protein [Pyrinomonadaceae bacterium]
MNRKRFRLLAWAVPVFAALLFISLIRTTHARVEGTTLQEQLPAGVTFVTESGGTREYKLANGMKVLLVENRVAPVATMLVVYKVGSRNEAVGYTGSTHLLEHMMFKGTPTFNKAKNTQIAATLQRIGAAFNANTWYDRTMYFETVPSDQLELAVKLEADRMRNSLIADADRQSEMTVVRNELERGQNEPSEVLDEAIYSLAFREHPYHHPTIGWRTDVEGVPTTRLKTFYDTFYQPNNATAILVGDFDRAGALSLISKYFGVYQASAQPIPQVYTEEPPQQGERRVTIRRAGEVPLVEIAYHTPGTLGQGNVLSNEDLAKRALNPPAQNDTYPLAVLSTILSQGVTSRLYQALVEKQLTINVFSNADQHRDPGLFEVAATLRPGVEPRQVEEVILAELKRVTDSGVTQAEIDKAKQQILAQEAFNRDGTFNIAAQMAETEAIADWHFFQDYSSNISKVTAADVQRVATTYFTEDNRTVGYFIPKHAAGGNQPAGARPSGLQASDSDSLSRRGVEFYRTPGARASSEDSTRQHDSDDSSAAHAQNNRGRADSRSASSSATPASAQGGGSTFASRVTRTQLPNGATLLVLENHATPTVALRGSFRAGSYFDSQAKPGLALVTGDMLERGTQHRTKLQLASDLESVGAEIDYSTDQFAVNMVARSLSRDLPLMMRTLAEEMREPSFPAEELEKLKQQLIGAIREDQARTSSRAYERFSELVFDPSNPFYQRPGEELIRSIQSITVEDVRNFYNEHYGGRSLIIAVAGDVNAADVRRQFEEVFGAFAGPRSIDINVTDAQQQAAARREVLTLRERANVDIVLGSAAPLRRNARDYYAAILANRALGQSTLSSRLGLEVRDRQGLTYGINSRFRTPGLAAGPWYIGVSVNPKNVDRAIAATMSVLRDYVQNGIKPDELAAEKSSAIGSFKVSLATNAGIAGALWNAEFYNLGADYIDRYPQIINSVTLEEVNAAIKKYFRPDQMTIVIAGDYDATPANTPTP